METLKRFGGYFLDCQFYNDGVVVWIISRRQDRTAC